MKVMSLALGALLTLSSCAPLLQETPAQKDQLSLVAFDSILAPHFDQHSPGASVIVTKRGRVLFRKAYGLANIEQDIPLQADDLFRAGSLTKQFTAAAVILLAQEGKLALSDPITRYLQDYPTHGQVITIEHLLTHSSGIRDYVGMPGFVENMTKDKSVNELIAGFKDEPIQFTPGSKFAYSNSGYVLLGAIIERVRGLPYHEFMARNIFIPLGMKATAVDGYERDAWAARGSRVLGYRRGDTAPLISASQAYAAGSLVTNVDDLARWDAAITDGKLLKPDNWRRMFSRYHLSGGELTKYGYGWFLSSRAGHTTAEHGGLTSGFSSYVLRMPQEGVYVAILTNNDLSNILSMLAAKISGSDASEFAAKLAEAALAND